MNKYEIILDVCKTKSISKTSEKFNYTQSAVSQTIRNFEKELGITLFKRSKLGMEVLTNAEPVIDSLAAICQEEKHLEQLVADITSLDSGNIRIGSIQSISYHWLPGILKRFSEAYPGIHFELYVDGFGDLIEKMKNNELDCIFVSKFSVPDYPFVPIGEDELMLVTPKNHPLSLPKSVSVNDVNGERFVLSSDGLDYETGQLFHMNHIHPKIQYQLNEDYATIKMVEQGFGITILPKLLLKNIPFDVCVRSFSEHYKRILGVAYPADITPSPAMQKLLDFAVRWSHEREQNSK